MKSITEKKCSKCGLLKDLSCFHKDRRSKSTGVQGACKDCQSSYVKKWNKENRAKATTNARNWRMNNPEKVKASVEKWQSKPENYEKVRKNWLSWYENNKKRKKARTKKWRKDNPDKVAQQKINRYEREKNAVGKIKLSEWNELCALYGNKCLCCGSICLKPTLDHVIPLSKGGSNTIDNVQPLCFSCNSKKGAKTIDYRPFHEDIDWEMMKRL